MKSGLLANDCEQPCHTVLELAQAECHGRAAVRRSARKSAAMFAYVRCATPGRSTLRAVARVRLLRILSVAVMCE